MKILRSFYNAGGRNFLLVILLLAGASMWAQQRRLQVVSDHSTASVFLGTEENPTSFDIGIAKVTGEIQFSSDDIGASQFNITISSVDLGDKKLYGESSVITFQSDSVKQRKDGKLAVHGQLTVTQLFGAEGDNKDSSGAVDNSKQIRTSEEVTFIFDGLEQPASSVSDSGSGDVAPVRENGHDPGMPVHASISVNGETFPQLLLVIQGVAWPLIADDQNCAAQSTPDNDRSGAPCTQSSAQSGDVQAPSGNLVTIRLTLILAATDSDSAGSNMLVQ